MTKPKSVTLKLSEDVIEELLGKLRHARCVPKNYNRKKTKTRGQDKSRTTHTNSRTSFDKIVAIGASTGGPNALRIVLENLPPDLNAPVLVVQHMPKYFTKAFAERLDAKCDIQVKEAEDGEVLKAGFVYIAEGDSHLRLEEGCNELTLSVSDGEKVSGHRPSVDAMFKSLVDLKNVKVIGVLMTGMGRDGAEGMLQLKKNGAKTIAQDKSSSVVYGMPKAAYEMGAVDKVCPLVKIAEEIISSVEV